MNRQMRRMQAKHANGNGFTKPLGQLQGALEDLKKVTEFGQAAREVEGLASKLKEAQGLVDELTGLREDLRQTRARESETLVELDRQRAVFLRFLFAPNILMSSSGQANLEKFLVAEQRYREEYDAMRLLVRLLTWAKEAP